MIVPVNIGLAVDARDMHFDDSLERNFKNSRRWIEIESS